MAPIIVVAIDINRKDEYFGNYQDLNAKEQILWLKERVIFICNELKSKAPNSFWILAWREYGVYEDKFNRALLPESKHFFKQCFSALVERYAPNLVIVAGTISTAKHCTNYDKLNDLASYFQQHAWVQQTEDEMVASLRASGAEDSDEFKKKCFVKQQLEMMEDLKLRQTPLGFYIIRNTGYVFYPKKETNAYISQIFRHDKLAGVSETDGNLDLPVSVFQTAKGRNVSPYLELEHFLTHEKFLTAFQTCREHGFNSLGHIEPGLQPKFQFILSDSTYLNINYLYGDYILQLDSKCKPRLITRNLVSKSPEVDFYQHNALTPPLFLLGPLVICYPFELQVFDKLMQLITSVEKVEEHLYFHSILVNFINFIYDQKEDDNQQSAFYLIDQLSECKAQLELPQTGQFFSYNPIREEVIKLHNLAVQETKKFTKGSDFFPHHDACLQDPLEYVNYLLKQNDWELGYKTIAHYNLWHQLHLTVEQMAMLVDAIGSLENDDNRLCYLTALFGSCQPLLLIPHDLFESTTLLHYTCKHFLGIFLEPMLPFLKDIIDVKDDNGNSPLHLAISHRAPAEFISALLDAGADVSLCNAEGEDALALAQSRSEEIFKLIESYIPNLKSSHLCRMM